MMFEPDWLSLSLGSLVIILPILVVMRMKLNIMKLVTNSFARMVVQLILAGFYLKYIIDLNNLFVNFVFVLIMIAAGSYTVGSRTGFNSKFLFLPIFSGFIIGFISVSIFNYLLYFRNGEYLNAQFMIPISGMLIGNSLSSAVVGIRSFFERLENSKARNNYLLVHGLEVKQFTRSIMQDALNDGFRPMLANISAIGLIWIPGTMTGQIITGASPLTAIKYQIMIVFGYFACCVLTSFFSIYISRNLAFDDFGRLNETLKRIKS